MASKNPEVPAGVDVPAGAWPHEFAAEVLSRVKQVAQRIAERVRHVADDTRTDHGPLPSDPTAEQPPVP